MGNSLSQACPLCSLFIEATTKTNLGTELVFLSDFLSRF